MTRVTISDKQKTFFHNPKKRLSAILIATVFLFVAVFCKLAFVMAVQGKELQTKALSQWLRDVPVDAPRGDIKDKNGEILASTATRYTLYVRPNSVSDRRKTANIISGVLGYDEEEVYTKIGKSASEITVARAITKEQLSAIYALNPDGVYYSEENYRYYPYGDFMTQVLGFTGFDGNGQTGIEAYYDKYLTGIDGAICTETDLVGRELAGGNDYYSPAIAGLNVVTTVDVKIQLLAAAAIQKAVAVYNPKAAACIVMNYKTGEIAALSEYPSFDLNNVPRDDLQALFLHSKSTLVSTVFEPGSTFKIVTAASALDCGAMTVDRHFYCAGSRIVDGKKIRCWKTKGHGSIDFGMGVEQSCNCVFMDSALALGTDRFYGYLKNFGLTKKSGVDLTGETSGILITQKDVKTVDLARIGFGQAIAVTPIGLLAASSAVINGGIKVTPHLLNYIEDSYTGKRVYPDYPQTTERIISEKTSATMRELLTRVVTDGSGKGAAVNGYNLAGKTGTAQKYANGAVAQGKYISSFLGFSLEEEAPYGILLMVDEPQGYIYYGSLVAAPLVGDIFRGIFSYLNVAPDLNAKDIEKTFDPENIEEYAVI